MNMDDTTRKIYRILCSQAPFEWFALDVTKIARQAIRSEQQVKDAVNWLYKNRYLEWDKQANKFRVPFK